jgi:hypothetical protein
MGDTGQQWAELCQSINPARVIAVMDVREDSDEFAGHEKGGALYGADAMTTMSKPQVETSAASRRLLRKILVAPERPRLFL